MPFAPQPQHHKDPFDPLEGIPAYSFEHGLEQSSEGRSDVWVVIDKGRGDANPMARCESSEDAMVIADALNRQ